MPGAPPRDVGLRPYRAIVWAADPTVPGKRVELLAESVAAANTLLREEFGPDATISLWNEEEASRPR